MPWRKAINNAQRADAWSLDLAVNNVTQLFLATATPGARDFRNDDKQFVKNLTRQ
jgi:hypothetical protein